MEFDKYFFWQDWPVRTQQMFFATMVFLWGFVLLNVWSGLNDSELRYERITRASKAKIAEVTPMVNQLKKAGKSQGGLASLQPRAAVQKITRDLMLDRRLTSIRPVQDRDGGNGVLVIYEKLNLPELVGLFKDFSVRGSLVVKSFSINHRLDNPDLADVQVVLQR